MPREIELFMDREMGVHIDLMVGWYMEALYCWDSRAIGEVIHAAIDILGYQN